MTKWIKVEDKLPDDKEYILCFTNMKKITTGLYVFQEFYLSDDDWTAIKAIKVTHWAKLPKPPEDEV